MQYLSEQKSEAHADWKAAREAFYEADRKRNRLFRECDDAESALEAARDTFAEVEYNFTQAVHEAEAAGTALDAALAAYKRA